MDTLLSRYRSMILLLVMVLGQLVLLAYQVKTNNDVRLIRVWAVTAVMPMAQVAEATRSTVYGVFHNYFDLRNARDENRRIKTELDKLKLENQFLKTELNTADRVKALAAFEKQTPSKLLAARIIGTATTSTNKVVFLDRGTSSGVEKGMAVITPDGIVGMVVDAFPTAAQAQLATDPGFAAGVVSQKNRVHGVLRGIGSGKCKIENVQNEEKVEVGEMFYTSGDDRVFPRGMPVGRAAVVRDGENFKDILVYPSGLQNGPEEVLIVLQGVHQSIPDKTAEDFDEDQKVYLGPPPPETKQQVKQAPMHTAADGIVERYQKIGEQEGHKYGEGSVPNFNVGLKPEAKPAPGTAAPAKAAAATPGAATPAPKPPAVKSPAVKPITPKPALPRPIEQQTDDTNDSPGYVPVLPLEQQRKPARPVPQPNPPEQAPAPQ